MRKIFSKKGEQETSKLTVILIVALAILVLFLLFYSVYGNRILDYLRGLPSYRTNQTDKIIEPGKLDGLKSSLACNVKIGYIASGASERNFIFDWVAPAYSRIFIGSYKTDVLIYGNGNIELDEYNNEYLGKVDESGVIRIESKWINDEILRAEHQTLPSSEQLSQLNGAILTKTNDICSQQEEKNE